MKKYTRLSALALCGALILTLAACGSKEPDVTETPDPVETVTPTETPEIVTPDPDPTESVEVVTPPAETDAVVEPLESQAPAPEGSKLQAVWDAIATHDLPFFMDLDDDLLSAFYGIDPADLVEYIGKIPAANVQATEFFLAQVQPGKMDTVKEALENRQADLVTQWAQYLPEQLEMVKNYKLVENGDYIMFAIADCADDAVTQFNTYTK